MKRIASPSELPSVPAVYAMYGGSGRSRYVAYVGVADALKTRLVQHLVRQDSSVTAGTSAVGLNPDYITEACWWEDPDFRDRQTLEAAELVAFDVLEPALRSRGGIRAASMQLAGDPAFRRRMEALFRNQPSGRLEVPTLASALERIMELERRVAALDRQLEGPR